MTQEQITVAKGFAPDERDTIARLFWAAFSGKLGRVMNPTEKALAVLAPSLDPQHCLTARDPQGVVLGAAGFKTPDGAFIGGSFADYRRVYGGFGAVWRVGLLSLLERDLSQDSLLMDGIFVSQNARGRGVGSALLAAIKAEARARNLHAVRLNVINSNPRARALYLRHGFVSEGTETMGPLRHIFNFDSAEAMVWTTQSTHLADAATQRIDIDT